MTQDVEELMKEWEVKDPITALELTLQSMLFHHSSEEARPVINEYLLSNPILLIMKGRDYYYKNF